MNIKVLIVDDERIILLGLKSVIEKIQDVTCTVRMATNMRQALNLLEEEPCDLLISDVQMKGGTGLELIYEAKAKRLAKHFIVLSGYDNFSYAQTALRLNVEDYLLKPVDKDQLRMDICHIAHDMDSADELSRTIPFTEYYPHLSMKAESTLMQECFRIMEKKYASDLSLSSLAEETGRTETYLSRLFKKEFEATFLDIINEMRLRESLYELFYRKDLSIHDIAANVGYKTDRQLFRLYRQIFGLTPQQIRDGEDPLLPPGGSK